MAKKENWWLKKDCRKCADYPDCDLIETKSDKPRGCSLWHEQPTGEGLTEEITLLYCKWCPKDCKGLTKEERIGCLAAGGFVDDFLALGHSSPGGGKDKVEEARREERERICNWLSRRFFCWQEEAPVEDCPTVKNCAQCWREALKPSVKEETK